MGIKGRKKTRKRVMDSFKLAQKHMRKMAKELAKMQKRLIEESKKPDGSPQKRNAPKYEARKKKRKNRKPLQNKFVLQNPANWRIRRRDKDIVIRPPRSRELAVAVLSRWGFEMVFDEIPEKFLKYLEESFDKMLKEEGIK